MSVHCIVLLVNTLYIIAALILYLKFRKQLKSELKQISENKKTIVVISIIAIIMAEICCLLTHKQTIKIYNTCNSLSLWLIAFPIDFFFVTIIAPLVEEMLLRKLLYLELKPKKTLQEAVKNHNWCCVFWYILLITINSEIFALLHYGKFPLNNTFFFRLWIHLLWYFWCIMLSEL